MRGYSDGPVLGSELIDLIQKVRAGERLNFADGVRLFDSSDLLAIGYMADIVRRRKNGNKVYFIANEPTIGENISKTDATMYYGQMENVEQKVGHLLRLRESQDETRGFLTFVPMASQPTNTTLVSKLTASRTTGFDDLKVLAVGRILLDNFEHVKAFCMLIGPKLAQVSLGFGVDDLDGTAIEEIGKNDLVKIIESAGYEPIERDTLHNPVSERNS